MNSEQVPQQAIQKVDSSIPDEAMDSRLAELNPDDFSEEGEPGFEGRSSQSSDKPTPDWNPDDFPGG